MSKYVVINPDGTYAGVLCDSYEEARELATQKKGRVIGKIVPLSLVEHIHCPVNGCDCPYWKNGICELDDPINECDDFASVWDKNDNYTCDGGEDCGIAGYGIEMSIHLF